MASPPLHYDAFVYLKFFKTGKEIQDAAAKKITALESKIKERKERINTMVTSKGLDSAQLLVAMGGSAGNAGLFANYALSNTKAGTTAAPAPGASGDAIGGAPGSGSAIFTAGEKQLVDQEISLISTETSEVKKMTTIINNLRASDTFELSFQDLEYLEF
jgi:hypothetical protein